MPACSYFSDSHPSPNRGRGDPVQYGRPHYGSHTLGQEVEDCFSQAQLPAHNHGYCDRWIDMSPTNVAEALHHGGNSQAKAERDEHEVGGVGILSAPVDGWTEAKQDKDQHGRELSRHTAPELLSPDALKGSHSFVWSEARWRPGLRVWCTGKATPPGRERGERKHAVRAGCGLLMGR